jgi:hypothetical protein
VRIRATFLKWEVDSTGPAFMQHFIETSKLIIDRCNDNLNAKHGLKVSARGSLALLRQELKVGWNRLWNCSI